MMILILGVVLLDLCSSFQAGFFLGSTDIHQD